MTPSSAEDGEFRAAFYTRVMICVPRHIFGRVARVEERRKTANERDHLENLDLDGMTVKYRTYLCLPFFRYLHRVYFDAVEFSSSVPRCLQRVAQRVDQPCYIVVFQVGQVSARDSAGLCVSVMTGSCLAHLTVIRTQQECPL